MTKSKITVYTISWHVDKLPVATREVLQKAMGEYIEFEFKVWADNELPYLQNNLETPIVFFQLHPPLNLFENYYPPTIWIPMADALFSYSIWESLPKDVRIISFAKPVSEYAQKTNLDYIEVQYFPDPSKFKPVNWKQEYNAIYWNRRGLIGPKLIEKICTSLKIKNLFFLPRVDYADPTVSPEIDYLLPEKIGGTIVHTIKEFIPREEYLNLLSKANFFFAPRSREGIGLSFLEAMAGGSIVLAYNSTTMNDYIKNKHNGILFSQKIIPNQEPIKQVHSIFLINFIKTARNIYNTIKRIILKRLPSKYLKTKPNQPKYIISNSINLSNIILDNYSQIGTNAKQSIQEGYANWVRDIPKIVSFILDWK